MKFANSKTAREPSSPSAPPPDPVEARRLRSAELPRETEAFARRLIGTLLVRETPEGRCAGRIVETEAYVPGDAASHAYRRKTRRNGSMFERHGIAYVYRIYGTSFCLNVASEAAGIGAAVLIRALEPVAGLALMRERRGPAIADRDLARGPGRLCAALAIDLALDGIDLDRDRQLWLADDGSAPPPIGVSTRIGLTRGADRPLRFYAVGSRALSGPRALSPGPAV